MNSSVRAKPAFGYLLNDVTRHLRRHFDRRAIRLGLTRAQWRALKTIARKEGMSQAELAEQLEMEPIPVGRVIDRLQQAGFVERRADPTDRRRWCLHLAARAHQVVGDMDAIALQLRAEALAGISRADVALLVDVLERIKGNLVARDAADRRTE